MLTELMSGTYRQLLNDVQSGAGELYPEEAFDVLVQTASALTYLHNLLPYPIIHLDVKADNIFIQRGKRIGAAMTETGEDSDRLFVQRAVLADFGEAAILSDDATLSFDVGTPEFMAPEVSSSDPRASETPNYGVEVEQI